MGEKKVSLTNGSGTTGYQIEKVNNDPYIKHYKMGHGPKLKKLKW